jgi:hypothetical protein
MSPMNIIDAATLLTIIYVLVDDWYQKYGYMFESKMPGPKPTFSDSEMLTLLLAMDYFPYPGEQQFLGFIRANHLKLFPKLLDQNQLFIPYSVLHKHPQDWKSFLDMKNYSV